MEDGTNLANIPPQGQELSPGAGGQNANVQGSKADQAPSEAPVLEQLSKLTGKKFASIEEAAKKIQGLEKLVGDQKVVEYRRKAEAYDQIANNELTPEEAKQYLAPFVGGQNADKGGKPDSALEQRLNRLERNQEKKDFVIKYPHAAEIVDELSTLAGDKPLEETFLNSKLSKLVAKKDSTENATIVPNKRVAIPTKEQTELEERIKKGVATDAEKMKLVNLLGLAKERQ